MLRLQLAHRLPAASQPLTLDLALERGERLAIYGPTGAGKTTLLRCIAGLERPDAGRIALGEDVWFDAARAIDRPVQRRALGCVFQEPALLPHLCVRDNVAFAQPRADAGRLAALLALAELGGLEHLRPAQLSGGQRQRVALARALAREAPLWLLDEPLSAQDAALRVVLRERLLAHQRATGATLLFVTHDLGEVFHLAGRVVQLAGGAVRGVGTPRELLLPATALGRYALAATVLAVDPVDVLLRVTLAVGGDVVTTLVGAELGARLRPGRPAELLLNGSSALVRPLD